jgi:hydrogenase maturation factor
VGDALVLAKAAAIEATAIIANEKAEEVESVHGTETTRRSQNFLFDPGISVVGEAALARDFPLHAMHDPTEGGIATGIGEICTASKKGALVEAGAIKVLPETALLCRQFGIDPLGAISSGALLLTLPPEAAPDLVHKYREAGIHAAIVGEILPSESGLQLREADGKVVPLPLFATDEITKLYT